MLRQVFGESPEAATGSLGQDSLAKASEKLEIIQEENEVANEPENKVSVLFIILLYG